MWILTPQQHFRSYRGYRKGSKVQGNLRRHLRSLIYVLRNIRACLCLFTKGIGNCIDILIDFNNRITDVVDNLIDVYDVLRNK